MTMQFTVLASGSSGNSNYLACGGYGLLIDIGLGPKKLESRLAAIDISWQQINAVLLTHTHTDHWNDRSFSRLLENRIPLYCHIEHHAMLLRNSKFFAELVSEGLVLAYELDAPFKLAPSLRCLPLRLQHDAGLTCGFRFEGPVDMFGQPTSLGYASDLGCWDRSLIEALVDVELLALEFNHDVELQKRSRRSQSTIARNLGNQGHLSNKQAAEMVAELLKQSAPYAVRYLVQLHLSQECNRPEIALESLESVLNEDGCGLQVHTASQHEVSPVFTVGDSDKSKRSRANAVRANGRKRNNVNEPSFEQSCLPGWEH